MTIPNKCKMHDGAHDYAKHDCGHEYCPVYWSSCPRCHGREFANMRHMEGALTFEQAMREVFDGGIVQRRMVNALGHRIICGHVKLERNRVVSANPYEYKIWQNYILTMADYTATDWRVIV